MKICLILPPLKSGKRTCPPYGLASLAACLEKENHKLKIIDAFSSNYTIKKVIQETKDFDPDIIGISVPTECVYNAYNIAEGIKKINPNCLTVVGGPHPSVLPEEVLKECPFIDVVVRGEGEVTFSELVDKFEKNQGFEDVLGISFRKDDRIISNSNRPLIEDLDSLPLPAYHLLPMKQYKHYKKIPKFNIKGNFGAITTCRGCPYNCNFCASRALWGKKWRSNSPKKIVEELKILKDKYKIKIVEFADDTFTVDKKNVEKICKEIKKEDLDIYWSCSSRVGLVDKELIHDLKSANCYLIGLGIESGVQKTLDFLCKGFKIEDAVNTVNLINKEGLLAESNFIIGVPCETIEMINQTIDFANRLELNWAGFSLLTPFPGTQIYDYAVKNDLLLTKDWSKYNFFDPVIKVPGIKPKELKNLLYKALFKSKIRGRFY